MTDTSEPTLNWDTAPAQFREAFNRSKAEAAEGLGTVTAERDALQRQVAMLSAGVDMGHPAAEYFAAGYSGDLKVDDIKAAWDKIAGTPSAEPPATPQVNEDGTNVAVAQQLADLQAQRDQLGQGTPPGEEPSVDPQTAMIQDFHERQKQGRNREQAMNLALDGLIEKAVAGDSRVTATDPQGSVRNWRAKQGF